MATLAELHRQARDLERAHRRGDEAAIARVAPWRPDARKPLKDAGAQLVVAREHGFPTWVRLRTYLERVDTFGEGLEHPFRSDVEYYEDRAEGLLASALDGTPGAVAAFEGTRAELTTEGARQVVAARHGFATWAALRRHVESLEEGGEPFARAFRALEAGDLEDLRAVLERFPEIARANGTNGNALINLARDPAAAELLVAFGAGVGHANAHGWTPLHQAAYANAVEAARALLAAGAPADGSARGAGGTPLVVALFWGNREVAEMLEAAPPPGDVAEVPAAAPPGEVAEVPAAAPPGEVAEVLAAAPPPGEVADAAGGGEAPYPGNLRVAAGLGRVELIEALVPAPGAPAEAAGALRGFYRPHGGFPAWKPSDDPQEILDEALSWAARSGRNEAVEALAGLGARVDADVYRGTPLAWAAARGRASTITRLVALGADPNGRSTFGGPTHGEGVTPLHLAAESGSLSAIEALLIAGADPTLRDALHDGDAAGWADHGGHPEAAALLRSR